MATMNFLEPLEIGTEAMVEWIQRFEAGVDVHPSVLAADTAEKITDRQKKLLILSLGTPALDIIR